MRERIARIASECCLRASLLGGCAKDADTVFSHADAGILILGAHDVICMIYLEEGGKFFVENLSTLIIA